MILNPEEVLEVIKLALDYIEIQNEENQKLKNENCILRAENERLVNLRREDT